MSKSPNEIVKWLREVSSMKEDKVRDRIENAAIAADMIESLTNEGEENLTELSFCGNCDRKTFSLLNLNSSKFCSRCGSRK